MNKYFAAFIISENLLTPAQKNLPKWKLVICVTVHYSLNWMYEFLYSKNLSDFKENSFTKAWNQSHFAPNSLLTKFNVTADKKITITVESSSFLVA